MVQHDERHGGQLVAQVLAAHQVPYLFTLCGGHISPLLVAAREVGIRVIDVRHEASAVFAADAVARLTGVPGVAAVTAGPGATNTITAVKNAQLAQSPVVLLGGATATLLKDRGALQDIDQMALMRPHVKWAQTVRQMREIVPVLEQAFALAQCDVPGPVFVELPVDLLYPESLVREWYGVKTAGGRGIGQRLFQWYVNRHVNRLFDDAWSEGSIRPRPLTIPTYTPRQVEKVAAALRRAERPVMVLGSGGISGPQTADALQEAVLTLEVPTYLSGMARGLLGRHPLHMRHGRRGALKEADLVILAGVPMDFRLDYGRAIPRRATHISISRSREELTRNRRPNIAIQADPAPFLIRLAELLAGRATGWSAWQEKLTARQMARDAEIAAEAEEATAWVNPLRLCQALEEVIGEDSIIIGDGGDFVATASYVVRPRGPLTWLDPGAFGTLGVGGGFALGSRLCRPEAEIWLLYGDGSAAYSLAEFDTFSRHGLPVVAVIGNDAAWSQIAREQVEIFGDDVAVTLNHADYHRVAEGYGGEGLLIRSEADLMPCLCQAQEIARQGRPVLVNVYLGKTEFRKGSISM